MKRRTGPPPIYLASSETDKMPVAHSEERLLSLLATLEEFRMELHQVSDSELKALCELMVLDDLPAQESEIGQGQRLPPYLKLIK